MLEWSGLQNRLLVFRRNRALSNGGFSIGPSIDVLLEHNFVGNTPMESVSGTGPYVVANASRGALLRGNAHDDM